MKETSQVIATKIFVVVRLHEVNTRKITTQQTNMTRKKQNNTATYTTITLKLIPIPYTYIYLYIPYTGNHTIHQQHTQQ